MLSQLFLKALYVFTVAVLSLQNSLPAQLATCPRAMCVYLPIISQPPLIHVVRYVTTSQKYGSPVISGEIANNSNTAISGIILSATVIGGSGVQKVVTGELNNPTVLVIAPNTEVPFSLGAGGGNFYPLTSQDSVKILTWTAIITSQYRVANAALITRGPVYNSDGSVAALSVITVTVHNPYTQTLQGVDIFSWALGRFSDFSYDTCDIYGCFSHGQLPGLTPGEVQTTTMIWGSNIGVPLDAIHVSAQGIIAP